MLTVKLSSLSSVLPIWQPIGYSTYQITNLLAQKYGQKATHTGVLDPLAEGVILVLLGDMRFEKLNLTSLIKEYEFEITFGISTDSYDGLGKVTRFHLDHNINIADVLVVLNDLVGPYAQKVPLYSAQKVDGRKLFMYPKLGIEAPELPVKSGRIMSIELIEFKKAHLHEKIRCAISNIEKIRGGEFRQAEIASFWKSFIESTQDLSVDTLRVKVVMTKGLYVRSLCQDIAAKLNTAGFVSQLIRTKNGQFERKDCRTLESIFGEKFNADMFASRYATLLKSWKTLPY